MKKVLHLFLLCTFIFSSISMSAQSVGIGSSSFTPGSMLSVDGGLSVGNGYRTTAASINGVIIQGNVGIGTSSPTGVLEIVGATAGSSPESYLQITGATANNSNYPGIRLKGGTLATTYPALVLTNGGLATILMGGRDATSYPIRMGLTLSSNASASAYASINKYDGTTTTDLIYVKADGNVGIGTTTPNTLLSVYNGNESTTQANFTQSLTSGGVNIVTDYTASAFTPGIFWSTQNESSTKPKAGIYMYEDGGGSKLFMGTSNTYATGITNDGFVLNANGNVGLGSTAPAHKLDVVGGNARVTGELYLYSGSGPSVPYGAGVFLINGLSATTLFANSAYGPAAVTLGMNSAGTITPILTAINGGLVGIGTTSPGYLLTVNGEPAANGYTAFTNYSDRKLKKNISTIDNSLEKILKLNPVQYQYNEEYLNLYNDTASLSRFHKGFVAQEVKELFPEMVGIKKIKGKEYYDLNLSNLQVYLVKAVQEQQQFIESISAENRLLKKELENIRFMISHQKEE